MSAFSSSSLLPVVGRIFWMMIGPFALILTLFFILTSGSGWRTSADVLYFLILAGMGLGRWLDFQGPDPRRSDGEPASKADVHRYLVLLLAVGPALWVAANVVGNHLLAAQ